MIAFFISLDILLGLVNTSATSNAQILFISLGISSSAMVGIIFFVLSRDLLGISARMDNKRFWNDFLGSLLYLIPIIAANIGFNLLIPGSRFSASNTLELSIAFSIINAFAEEMLFTLGLGTVLYALAKNNIQRFVMLMLNATLFAAYHIFVYANYKELAIVLVLRITLNFVYLKTQRISTCITLHMINNLIAILPMIIAAFATLH
jgi:membrane protease YdiL (CAAX protease family)